MTTEVKYQEFGDKLVAVYGTLRKGNGNYKRHLEDAEYLGTEVIKGHGMVSLGGFPAVYRSKDPEKGVVVEVFRPISEEMKRGLDGLEGYREGGDFYDRKVVKTKYGDAWMYFMDGFNDESDDQIVNGDWMKPVLEEDEPVMGRPVDLAGREYEDEAPEYDVDEDGNFIDEYGDIIDPEDLPSGF